MYQALLVWALLIELKLKLFRLKYKSVRRTHGKYLTCLLHITVGRTMFPAVTLVLLVLCCGTALSDLVPYWNSILPEKNIATPSSQNTKYWNSYRTDHSPQQSYPAYVPNDKCNEVPCPPIICRYGQITLQGQCCPQCIEGIYINNTSA